MTTSLMAGEGSGWSVSLIPAVPAFWSVTTMAFIGLFFLSGSGVARGTDEPGIRYRATPVHGGSVWLWGKPVRALAKQVSRRPSILGLDRALRRPRLAQPTLHANGPITGGSDGCQLHQSDFRSQEGAGGVMNRAARCRS